MEIETTETFLEQLDLGNYKDTFKERGYELGILKEKCENELRRIIGELKLPFSTQDLIISEIQRLKTKGKIMLFNLFINFTCSYLFIAMDLCPLTCIMHRQLSVYIFAKTPNRFFFQKMWRV